jgi:hypothetical protein
MKNTIPGDSLTYIVGSDNPLLPDLILHLNKGENNIITGTGHIVPTSKDDEGFSTSQQLQVTGTYSITPENSVLIELNGFAESSDERVAAIQLTLDAQWSGGTGNYHYVKPYLHHAQLESKEEAVYQMSYAAQQIDPNNH